ncbi:Hypp2472 [Branchiostoma lanceolatum]|uniref:RNA-dependent RNA polymerase n=1 Tax=Branchiostoma lanceolatum TaxID=7740 RepID=A0A8J9ZR01_BRALA|nr:Hypp2472 [Branchiostoma lanceolatum]
MEAEQDEGEVSVTAGLQALSLSTPPTDREAQTLQGKVHNVTSPESQDDVKEAFLHFTRGSTWHDATTQQDGSHVITFAPFASQEASMSAICRQWCGTVEAGKPYWLEIPPNQLLTMERSSPKPTQLTSLQVLDVANVSFGCFLDHSTYISHWTEASDDDSLDISLHLEHDIQSLSVYMSVDSPYSDVPGPTEKLIIPYTGIENFVLVCSRNREDTTLFFPLNSVPRCFKTKTITNMYEETYVQEDRILSFSSCTPNVMGSSSVLAVHVTDSSADGSITEDVLHRLQKVGFDVYFSSTRMETAPRATTGLNKVKDFADFSVTYALRCLLSRGYKVSDRALPSFFSSVEAAARQDPIATAAALHQVADAWVDGDCFCDLAAAFQTELEVARTVGQNDAEDLPDHYVYARKVVVTPTQMLFLKPEPIVENRVVREYGVDNFMRVAFRDEDFNKLTAPNPNSIKCVTTRVKDVLQRGITIGRRHFEYLGSSNSQMREHGCWMYAADEDETTTSDIRAWMGDLSRERCVATYVSRLGQFFSSSRDAVNVSVEDRSVDLISDVKSSSRKYTFSDGIGKISVPLAEKVAEALGVTPVPSAFQIRYGGCKGVLAQDPTLGDTDLIHIRDSMKKFESEHKTLEVTSVTTPGSLSLNRQAITLLSGLGVPDEEFFKLQERVLNQLAEMLLLDGAAVKALSGTRVGINFQALHKSGISLTTEPFFRSMLLAVYRNQMGELLRRTRIQLPAGEGRIMMGTMDETGKLQYGEVFIQYSRETDKAQAEKVVRQGQVTVTKNPCFHPGDMRRFAAVDVPELHHMVDCIVFPSRGPRPHPDEMSGSDLDGDMYFVTWREGLILPQENIPAMDFTAQPKKVLRLPVQVSDMIEFFAEYIRNDQLGLIANAHLVHADKETKGIFSQKCMELARLHSDAVDFPKTGQCPELKRDLRPDKYPDFMMKSDKPQYRSEKIIGKLFRQCQALDKAQFFSPDPVVEDDGVDQDLIREGFESYTDHAGFRTRFSNI